MNSTDTTALSVNALQIILNLKITKPKIDIIFQSLPCIRLFFKLCDKYEIYKYITLLKSFDSCGTDKITNKHIKLIKNYISEPLVHVINLILSTGIFPETFKSAIILPIYKTGSKLHLSNYRPISLLSNL